MYQEAKKNCLEEFGKVAVGDIQRQYLVELKDKMKHKYNQLRHENEKMAEVSYKSYYLKNDDLKVCCVLYE